MIGHTVPMGWVRRAFAPKNWVPPQFRPYVTPGELRVAFLWTPVAGYVGGWALAWIGVPVWLTWPSAFVVGALIGRSQVRDWKARAFHEHLKP